MNPRTKNLFGCLILPLLTLSLGLALSWWLGPSFLFLPLVGFGVWTFGRKDQKTDGGTAS